MVIRKLVLAIVLTALGASPASATTSLRVDPSGGTLLPTTTTLRYAASDPAVFTTGLGSITCAQSNLDFDVTRNSSPTSISGTLTGLTFTSCTDTWPVLTFPDCSLHTANLPGITITAAAGGATVTINDMTLRCAVQGGPSACYFTAATTVGTANNANRAFVVPSGNALSVTPTSDAITPNLCGGTMTYNWTFTQLVQGGSNLPVTITTA